MHFNSVLIHFFMECPTRSSSHRDVPVMMTTELAARPTSLSGHQLVAEGS